MAPFKSSLARSAGKLLGVYDQGDLSLRGKVNRASALNPFVATGGDTYEPGNGYKYHVYTYPSAATDFVVVQGQKFIEVLVVGGGGAAGNQYYAGGGGGGGIQYDNSFAVGGAASNFTVTVGNGGHNPEVAPPEVAGTNGADSFFGPPSPGTGSPNPPNGLTGLGGGGGGLYPNVNASPGGSGGGEGSGGTAGTGMQPQVTVPGTGANYGTPGGGNTPTGAVASAGGGGAAQAGGDVPGDGGGPGGAGGNGYAFSGFEYPLIGLSPLVPSVISNSPTFNQYGGGGAGWGYVQAPSTDPGGTAGQGGGGWGAGYPNSPLPASQRQGTDHLGGGGAGGYPDWGAPGGSGIVVVRYLI